MSAKKKSPYQKGLDFEKEFAKFMKEELKYDKIKVRKQVSGRENIKGAEADIIGVEHDVRRERFRKAAIITLIIALGGFALSLLEIFPKEMVKLFLFVEGAALLYALLARRFSDKYTWVECKNWKTNISLDKVRELYNKVTDNNESRDRKFKVDKIFFVVRKGFVNVAQDYAHEHDITCFIKQDKSFVELKLWE